MEKEVQEQFEQYDYARRRLKQKKNLYFHFVLFLLGSLFMFVANKFLNIGATINWSLWAITGWFFIFILHFIKVYITDRFMNKNWEKTQIERLVKLQQKRLAQLSAEISNDTDTQNN